MNISIRKTKMSDANEIWKQINNPKVIKELCDYHFPCPLGKIKKDIKKGLKDWEKKKAYNFTIIYENKIVGQIMLEHPNKDKRRYEIGFFIGPGYWNKGIATKAIKEIVRFGFNELNLYKIWGDNDSDNLGSGKAMEKAGFKLEGRLRNHYLKNNKFIDLLIWGKCKR